MSRKKTFARDLGMATTSSKTESLSGSVGGVNFSVKRTTINMQRAIKFMPEPAQFIDLVDDDDGAGPSRRYDGFLCIFLALISCL